VVQSFYRSRLRQVGEERQKATLELTGLQQALRDYAQPFDVAPGVGGRGALGSDGPSTLIPQVSEAFIDRLIELSGSQEDAAFRQDLTNQIVTLNLRLAVLEREERYYDEAVRLVTTMRPGSFTDTTPAYADLRARLKRASESAQKAVGRIERFYNEVSARSLAANGELYRLVRAFTFGIYRAFDTTRFLVMAVVALVGAFVAGKGLDRVVRPQGDGSRPV
jgi:hypothetical protein